MLLLLFGILQLLDDLSRMSIGIEVVRVLLRFPLRSLFAAVAAEYVLVVLEVVAVVLVQMVLRHLLCSHEGNSPFENKDRSTSFSLRRQIYTDKIPRGRPVLSMPTRTRTDFELEGSGIRKSSGKGDRGEGDGGISFL